MIKKLIIVAVVILVLAGAVLGYALMNANSLIATYKPELERIASQAVGSKVEIGDLQASLFPRTRVRVGELKVGAEKPGQEGFTLKDLLLDVSLLPLLKKQLDITTLTISSPSITAIKDKDGIHIAGLPSSSAKEPKEAKPRANISEPKEPKEASAPSASAAPLNLNLQRARIEDATLTFKDLETNQTYQISQLLIDAGVAINGTNLTVPTLLVKGRALDKADFELKGANIQLQDQKASVPDLVASLMGNALKIASKVDLKDNSGQATILSDGIELTKFEPLMALAPEAVRALKPAGTFIPNLKASWQSGNRYQSEGSIVLKDISALPAGFKVTGLKGEIKSTASHQGALFSSNNIELSLNGEPVKASFEGSFKDQNFALPKIVVNAFSGTADGSFTLTLNEQKPFSTVLKVQGLDAAHAMAVLGTPAEQQKFSAKIQLLTANLNGALSGNVPQSINGSVALDARQATVKGFNLLSKVLQAVKGLPFMQGALIDAVPPAQRGSLESPDTVISSLTATGSITNGVLFTKDLKATSDLFSLVADGSVGFDSSVNLNTTLILTAAFSEALIKSVKELKSLTNAQGEIIIPLTLKGTAPKLIVLPNIQKLLETGAGRILQEKAGDLLGKALGGKKSGGGNLKKLLGF